MQDTVGNTSYTLDALNRNTVVVNPFNKTVQYGYDARGQRASMTNWPALDFLVQDL